MRLLNKASFLLFFALPFVASAQERMPGGDMQARLSPILYEAIPVFGPDTSKAYVNIHYRIPNSFFVFVKPGDPAAPRDELRARGQLLVELFDSLNVSVARDIRPITLVRSAVTSAPAQAAEADIEGAASFAIPAGVYQIVFEVDDLESGRTSVDRKRTVTARLATLKSLDLSAPFFASADTTRHPEIRYIAFNHGTNVMFGGPRGGLVSQIYCRECDSALTVQWTLRGETDSRTPRAVDLTGTRFKLTPGQLSLVTKEGPVAYDPGSLTTAWKALFVPLPLEKLEPGRYKVELKATDGKEKFSHEMAFQVIWPGRPMSLMDWDVATDALKYIATPQEVDRITSAPTDEGQELFRAFWRKHDPDTTTAYNEMMVEYYRRVDEATRRFSTTKEGDGYRTDRGKIYILFGPPTNTQRSLLPGQPVREIWTYDNVKKRFIFVDKNKSGNFILAESSNL